MHGTPDTQDQGSELPSSTFVHSVSGYGNGHNATNIEDGRTLTPGNAARYSLPHKENRLPTWNTQRAKWADSTLQ
jgi:hypothetical protein